MSNCPVCDAWLQSAVCTCGYDRSRDYERFPTFGQLPAGLLTFESLYADEPEPRTARVKCPECGQEAVICETDNFPVCAKCDKGPLNPTDALQTYSMVFQRMISEKQKDPLKLYALASYIPPLFSYADRERAQKLADTFRILGENPGELGLTLPESIQSLFAAEAKGLQMQLEYNEIEKNIFDEQEAENQKQQKERSQFARSIGFRRYRGSWHFMSFDADAYRRHTAEPQFCDAMDAYRQEDYAAAWLHFRAALDTGNPYAAAYLGLMHHYGRGCEKDLDAALECFKRGARAGCPLAAAWITEYYRMGHSVEKDKAFSSTLYAAVDPELQKMCEAGDPEAQYFRGFNLVYGINIEKNLHEGIRLLQLATDQGHRSAATELAYCFYNGDGVAKDRAAAFRLLTDHPLPDRRTWQYLLGVCYYWGEGTQQNYDLAFPCFKRAAELGHGRAKEFLGDCYRLGEGTEKDYTQAAKWYHDAADNHQNANSAYFLGLLYDNGLGVEKDQHQAIHYWKLAAEEDHALSQYHLGRSYLYGYRIQKDEELGLKWLTKAAEQGLAEAMHGLGCIYLQHDTPEDDKIAIEWLQKAAKKKYAVSERSIGGCYEHGIYFKQDYAEAAKWYQLAAEHGEPDAMLDLSRLYLEGLGVDRDPDKGIEYLNKALDAGHTPAARELAKCYHWGIADHMGVSLYTNPTLAHKYAMTAVQDESDGEAQYLLGRVIHYDFGNPRGAVDWYRRAVQNNFPEAKLELSKALIQLQENLDEAWQLLQSDNIPKTAEFYYWRSVCLENGWGTPKNKRLAKQYYNIAIEKGYVDTAKKKKWFGLF